MLTALFQSVNCSISPGETVAVHLLNLLIFFGHPSDLSKLLYPMFWNNIPTGE